jgi:hypothetical protein
LGRKLEAVCMLIWKAYLPFSQKKKNSCDPNYFTYPFKQGIFYFP